MGVRFNVIYLRYVFFAYPRKIPAEAALVIRVLSKSYNVVEYVVGFCAVEFCAVSLVKSYMYIHVEHTFMTYNRAVFLFFKCCCYPCPVHTHVHPEK